VILSLVFPTSTLSFLFVTITVTRVIYALGITNRSTNPEPPAGGEGSPKGGESYHWKGFVFFIGGFFASFGLTGKTKMLPGLYAPLESDYLNRSELL
jgi:hypothetical protein